MPNKPAPQHGGLIRVAFDGGQNIHNVLPFSAVAVNIDNWSPYWYKLNPVEEYIPPFQHGVNISLPLINNYEFVCQAPPGIEQSTIVPTTGIPGNTNPVIAIFSSFGTNNDAGFSALQASTNKNPQFTGFIGFTTVDIDTTLYDGIYLFVKATTQLTITIGYVDNNGFTQEYARVLYPSSTVLLTIPKITRIIRIIFNQDSNRPQTISGSYNIRAFIGPQIFDVQAMTTLGATVPQDFVNTIGESTTNFTVTGLDSVVLTVRPNGGAGVTLGTIYWIKVFATNVTGGQTDLLYTKTFIGQETGLGNASTGNLVLPITGLLNREVQQLVVFCRPSDGAVTLATAVVQLSVIQGEFDGLIQPQYSPPTPYFARFISAPPNGVWTLLGTLPVGGMFSTFTVNLRIAGAAGSECIFAVGTGTTQDIVFGTIPASIVNQYSLNDALPFRIDNGINSFWVFATVAGLALDIIAGIK